jgi:hypothetical protein
VATIRRRTIAAPAPAAIQLRAKRDRNIVGADVFASLTTAPLKVVSVLADRGEATGPSKDSLSRR